MIKVLCFLALITMQIGYSQNNVFAIARNGSAQEMEKLFKENNDIVNLLDDNGNSPLVLACYRNNAAVAVFLISHNASIDYNSGMGTALMAATVKGNLEIAKVLLEKKANPNLADSNGTTALIYAIQFKNAEMIKLLLKFKADKSLKDKSGKTAFEYAAFAGDEMIINLLK